MHDEWQHFNIKFSVNYGQADKYNQVRINGSRVELGNWNNGSGPIKMLKSEIDSAFLKNKFDVQMKPWEIIVKFKNDFDPNT